MADEVFAALPLAVLAFGVSKGIEPAALMAAGGLLSDDLRDPDAMVPYRCLPDMWELLLERHPDEALGLQYGRMLPLEIAGVVGFLLRHCADFRECLDAQIRFSSLVDPRLRVGSETVGTRVRLTLDHEPRVLEMREPIEMMVLSVYHFATEFLGRPLPAYEVSFRHPRRHDEALYVEAFGGVPVRFDAAYTGVTLDASLLDEKIPGAQPGVHRYLEAHAESLLAERDANESPPALDAQVRAALDQLLPKGQCEIEAIAKHLAMSTRSLQRGLRGCGTSFREQLDEVRRARALTLLEQRELSVQQIAFMLGYADPRNFYRCFRRWTDTTPNAYRAAL